MDYLISNKVKDALLKELVALIMGESVEYSRSNDTYPSRVYMFKSYLRGVVQFRIRVYQPPQRGRLGEGYGVIEIADEWGNPPKLSMRVEFYWRKKAGVLPSEFYSLGYKPIDSQKFLQILTEVVGMLESQYDREQMGVSEMTEKQLTILRK